MTRVIEIESTPALERTQLEAAFALHGLKASLVVSRNGEYGALLTFDVASFAGDLTRAITSALEDAIAATGAPLLCTSDTSACRYTVYPPAA